MGKKGSWISTLKRVFTPNSKEKLPNGSEKKSVKEKKWWGLRKLKHGEGTSFIPLYREPSSIEKILGEAEREHPKSRSSFSRDHQRTPSFATKPPSRVPSREQEQQTHNMHPRETSKGPLRETHNVQPSETHNAALRETHNVQPRETHNAHQIQTSTYISRATPNYHQIAAIKIQTAYRGYMARRSFRALKGLVRLQGVVRGQSVKRQTMNAMKCMQMSVRVQSQIHARRIQMLENQALQRQNLHKSDKEQESSLGRWTFTPPSEAEEPEEWDDSVLTKEEIEARMQRKVEAVIKRERALAYAYSHQPWKGTPKSAHNALLEMRSGGGGLPWWWNWIERQLPAPVTEELTPRAKNDATPCRLNPELNAQPKSNNYKQSKSRLENLETATPKSSKSSAAIKVKQGPILSSRTLQSGSSTPTKHAKPRASAGSEFSRNAPIRDDDSLTSCPSFSVPNYMVPTVSAKAKVRAQSNPKERSAAATPRQDSKRRLSFPLTQSIGYLFSGKDSSSQRISRNDKPLHSIGNVSIDSTLSLPAGVGRKPYK